MADNGKLKKPEEEGYFRVGILTVSDRCHKRVQEDLSGKNLTSLVKEKLSKFGKLKVLYSIVPDDRERIKEKLIAWCNEDCTLILTTGGTGFAPRDVTPEATRDVIEKEAPGLATKMLIDSLRVTQLAVLSRSVCGIRRKTIIINLPGSRKGSQECFESVLPALGHAVDLVRDRIRNVSDTHKKLESELAKFGDGVATKEHRGHHICPHAQQGTTTEQRTLDHLERVAQRERTSPYPMLSMEEAVSLILMNTPVLDKEEVSDLQAGLGRILVSDVYAKEPHPPFPASIKDGYAVIAADGVGERQVLEPIIAGDLPSLSVTSGYVSRITTGAPLPLGADAVVQVEDTELIESFDQGREESKVKILTKPVVGQDIRPIGFDIANGERVLCNGDLLGPAELGLLASVGVTKVSVVKRPVVGVLSTGNEIVDPCQQRRKGTVFDCNRTTLKSAIRQFGFHPVDLGIASDSPDDLIEKLRSGFASCDVVVASGGVSMGEKDIIKPVLKEAFNAQIHFGRVRMKPGKPTTFATVLVENEKKLIFALPGNPVSAIVTFHLFVLPALQKMSGHADVGLPKIKAKLTFTAKLDPRPEYQRAQLHYNDGLVPNAITTGNQCSSRLISMRSADCLLVLPSRTSEVTVLKEGEIVDALLLKR